MTVRSAAAALVAALLAGCGASPPPDEAKLRRELDERTRGVAGEAFPVPQPKPRRSIPLRIERDPFRP